MAVCKSEKCRAPINWGRNEETGKGIPLDPDPTEDGNLLLVGIGGTGELMVRYIHADEEIPDDATRYQTHFASCVAADEFRKD